MRRHRTCAGATALVTAISLAAAPVPSVAAAVRAPPDGATYSGSPGNLQLLISGRSVALAAFSFRCGATRGRASVNGVRLQRTSEGYRFRLRVAVSITFEDGSPDQLGEALLRGRFSRSARSARGTFWVRSSRCAKRDVSWIARRGRG